MRLPRLTILTCMLGIVALAALVAPVFDRALIGLAPATLLVILTAYAMPRRGGWRSRLATAGAVCGALLIPLVASALVSKTWWGYYLRPPAGPPGHRSPTRPHGGLRPDAGLPQWRRRRDVRALGPSARAIASAEGDPAQRRVARALIALDGRKKLPEEPARPESRRSMDLFPLMDASGQMYPSDGQYVNTKDLRGIVIEADGADGTPLVFLAARGARSPGIGSRSTSSCSRGPSGRAPLNCFPRAGTCSTSARWKASAGPNCSPSRRRPSSSSSPPWSSRPARRRRDPPPSSLTCPNPSEVIIADAILPRAVHDPCD